jgi:hypothetical protein
MKTCKMKIPGKPMENSATFKRLIAHCSFGAVLLAGWPGSGISQVIGPGQMTLGPASPLTHNPQGLYGRPAGLGAGARAASAVGQAATTFPASTPAAANATFVEFDVPGSACQAAFPRCTTPTAINPAGEVTGYYADANAALHGFVRKAMAVSPCSTPPAPYALRSSLSARLRPPLIRKAQ